MLNEFYKNIGMKGFFERYGMLKARYVFSEPCAYSERL